MLVRRNVQIKNFDQQLQNEKDSRLWHATSMIRMKLKKCDNYSNHTQNTIIMHNDNLPLQILISYLGPYDQLSI